MADSDLTQSNDTAVFPATADFNTNADPFLIPTDGKKITASSNAPNQAPVNRAIKRLHALVAGLRSALVGDFDGAANRKTIVSLETDGSGGFASTIPTGTIKAGFEVQAVSNVQAIAGYVKSGASPSQRTELQHPWLGFLATGSGAGDANPPSTTATPNQLRALNTPKCWVSLTTNGVAGTACIVSDAHGITAVTRSTTSFLVTFSTAFDSAEYSVLVGATDLPRIWVNVTNKLAGSCNIEIWDTLGRKDPVNVTTTSRIDLLFMGRQTT